MPTILSNVVYDDAGIRGLTQRQIKAILRNDEPRTFYQQSVEMAERIAVHADGVFPKKLIEVRRPNEAEQAQKYRQDIWIEKTKSTFDRMMLYMNKIRRSSEWSIRYIDEDRFARITPENRLSEYMEKKYPEFESVTNWVFKIVLKKYLIDPNAVLFVRPIELTIDEGKHFSPIGTIYMSESVLEFNPDYAILKIPEGSFYTDGNGQTKKGEAFYIITKEAFYKFEQINSKKDFAIIEEETFYHDLGILPAYQLQAVVKDQFDQEVLYESRIQGAIPEFDEALREYSDLQAARVLHLYPERYEYTTTQCSACKGQGKIKTVVGEIPKMLPCEACDGIGYTAKGPFGIHVITPSGIDEQQIPTPPIGYVEKNPEIIKLQDESVEAHLYSGLAALNLELVARVPASESGVAKQYDADGSNNTFNAIAEDLVSIMDRFYFIAALYRYNVQYSPDEIREMVPSINVPERFDIATSGMLEAEVGTAKTNKINPAIINQIELDYANKRFYNDPEIRDRLELLLSLDPLSNIAEESKNSMLMNKGITLQDYIISSNINSFITRALADDPKFAEKKLSDQIAVMKKFADEIISARASEGIKLPGDPIDPDETGDGENDPENPNGAE